MPARTTDGRPFGQRAYDAGLLRPEPTGPRYKFMVLIPTSEQPTGRNAAPARVFTDEDIEGLKALFLNDFGRFYHTEGLAHPLMDLARPSGSRKIVSGHVCFYVYGRKDQAAVEYFEELKARLLLHADEVRHVSDAQVIVERTEVTAI